MGMYIDYRFLHANKILHFTIEQRFYTKTYRKVTLVEVCIKSSDSHVSHLTISAIESLVKMFGIDVKCQMVGPFVGLIATIIFTAKWFDV